MDIKYYYYNILIHVDQIMISTQKQQERHYTRPMPPIRTVSPLWKDEPYDFMPSSSFFSFFFLLQKKGRTPQKQQPKSRPPTAVSTMMNQSLQQGSFSFVGDGVAYVGLDVGSTSPPISLTVGSLVGDVGSAVGNVG